MAWPGAYHGVFIQERSTQNAIIQPTILFLAWVSRGSAGVYIAVAAAGILSNPFQTRVHDMTLDR